MKKFIMPMVVLCAVVFVSLFALQLINDGVTKGSIAGDKCIYSEYNTYSNSTRGYVRVFNKCYVEVPAGYYMSERECGFLGISCWKTEPTPVYYDKTICFNLKTGEEC